MVSYRTRLEVVRLSLSVSLLQLRHVMPPFAETLDAVAESPRERGLHPSSSSFPALSLRLWLRVSFRASFEATCRSISRLRFPPAFRRRLWPSRRASSRP